MHLFYFYIQFKVLLFNDNGNTREYVSRSLVQVVGVSEATAFHIMQQVCVCVCVWMRALIWACNPSVQTQLHARHFALAFII